MEYLYKEIRHAAHELASYVSYAEIVGKVLMNRGPIREWCDKVYELNRKIEDLELEKESSITEDKNQMKKKLLQVKINKNTEDNLEEIKESSGFPKTLIITFGINLIKNVLELRSQGYEFYLKEPKTGNTQQLILPF